MRLARSVFSVAKLLKPSHGLARFCPRPHFVSVFNNSELRVLTYNLQQDVTMPLKRMLQLPPQLFRLAG